MQESIGFIGAGRVGVTLGRYFYIKNLHVSGYFSKTAEHARQAASVTNSGAYQTLEQLAAESQLIFIAVPDDCIAQVYDRLRQCDIRGKLICHCSGALSSGVFSNIAQAGAYGYSIHPAFAVSDKETAYQKMQDVFFTIEGDDAKLPVIQKLMQALGNAYRVMDAAQKETYHAALVTSSNLVIGLYHIAQRLLADCGFSGDEAAAVLNPLFLGNAESVCRSGCLSALTGPVDRGDIATVRAHLAALDDTAISAVYRLLSAELISIAKQKYPDRPYRELEDVLNA